MSVVSILEDIEKYREANRLLAERIPKREISSFDTTREVNGLLKQCKFIGECLESFSNMKIEECQLELLRAKLEIESSRADRDVALKQCDTIKRNCLDLLKEKEKIISGVKSKNVRLKEEVDQLIAHRKELREIIQKKDSDIRSLRYRTRLKGSLSGPGKSSKRKQA